MYCFSKNVFNVLVFRKEGTSCFLLFFPLPPFLQFPTTIVASSLSPPLCDNKTVHFPAKKKKKKKQTLKPTPGNKHCCGFVSEQQRSHKSDHMKRERNLENIYFFYRHNISFFVVRGKSIVAIIFPLSSPSFSSSSSISGNCVPKAPYSYQKGWGGIWRLYLSTWLGRRDHDGWTLLLTWIKALPCLLRMETVYVHELPTKCVL